MKNFIFKSADADLQKIVQLLFKDVTIMSNNITYMSYRIDSILKKLTDRDLQTTVDKYFDETSHQTDSDEQ